MGEPKSLEIISEGLPKGFEETLSVIFSKENMEKCLHARCFEPPKPNQFSFLNFKFKALRKICNPSSDPKGAHEQHIRHESINFYFSNAKNKAKLCGLNEMLREI